LSVSTDKGWPHKAPQVPDPFSVASDIVDTLQLDIAFVVAVLPAGISDIEMPFAALTQ